MNHTLEEQQQCYRALLQEYQQYKGLHLKLNMARGKPCSEQLDLSMGMMDALTSSDLLNAENGTDVRNYGVLEGLPEARALFGELLGVDPQLVIVGGNSSLNMMYDTVSRAMLFGFFNSKQPWCRYACADKKIKFLCPVPGYDRHFAICELFGIEMINIPMNEDGPDMDMVEKLVSEDELIKGIWCVPQYSNPDGITYSDEVVRRFANLSPKAEDFRIFWDNAYCVHHISQTPDHLLNLMDECKKTGKEDMVLLFCSFSKISFSGASIAAMAASSANLAYIQKQLTVQTIGFDKVKQLRHVRFFKNAQGVYAHMEKHRQIVKPRFDIVLQTLEKELAPLGIATWHKPNGGYFVSVNTQEGLAKRVVALCKEAGVVLTGAGATFPYGKDPLDQNIRIAPTYPSLEELQQAMDLFCLCVKLASLEKICG